MENSMSDPDVHQSFRSPPRRRRSTFFERRDSAVPQPVSENGDGLTSKKETQDAKRSHDISSYYDKLLSEKEQWKKELKDRRNNYHDLRQQYQMATKAPSRSRMSYSALSNEDIEFLKGKPNISKLIDTQQKLHKSVKETVALVRRANELDEIILRYSEDKVEEITEYILENSTVDR